MGLVRESAGLGDIGWRLAIAQQLKRALEPGRPDEAFGAQAYGVEELPLELPDAKAGGRGKCLHADPAATGQCDLHRMVHGARSVPASGACRAEGRFERAKRRLQRTAAMHRVANDGRDAAVHLVEAMDGVGALVQRGAQPRSSTRRSEPDANRMQAGRRLQSNCGRHLSDDHDLRLCARVADTVRAGAEVNDDLDAAIREDGLGQRVVAGFQFPEAVDISCEIGGRLHLEVTHGAADRSTR